MARRLEVVIVGDTRDLERALGRAGKAGKTFGQRIQTGARIAGLALAGTLAVAAKIGFDELAEGQKVAAQTNAVLKSTGAIANVTAGEVEGLAAALMEKSGIDDEVIASGENLLLTFKNIRNEAGKGNDVFNQATALALDLSVAFGKDMTTASVTLGKALNNPISGLTRLERVGVTFTDAQKKQITALTESGRVMEAQKIILAELESQVGGSAEAYGETLPGQIGKAKEQFANLSAELLVALLPAFTAVTNAALTATGWLQKHPKLAQALTVALAALSVALLAAASAQLLLNLAILANPFVAAAVALTALVAAFVIAYRRSETFRRVVQALSGALMVVLGILPTLALLASRHFGTVKDVGVAAFNAVRDAVSDVVGWVMTLIEWVKTAIEWLGKLSFSHAGPGRGTGPTDRSGNPRLGRSGSSTQGFGRGANVNVYGSVVTMSDISRGVQRAGLQAAFREGIV